MEMFAPFYLRSAVVRSASSADIGLSRDGIRLSYPIAVMASGQ